MVDESGIWLMMCILIDVRMIVDNLWTTDGCGLCKIMCRWWCRWMAEDRSSEKNQNKAK